MAASLQAVRGMNDVLPDEAPLWQRFEDTARNVFAHYGYRNLRVPIVEPTPLFVRGIGEHTDVVEHEMYTFEDKLNGDSLTLRPEATAGIVRAAIEHNLTVRPAAARVDRRADVPPRAPAEGPLSPVPPARRRSARLRGSRRRRRADRHARAAVARARALRRRARDQLDRRCRTSARAHRDGADRVFRAARDALDDDAQRRLHANPLRILDSKNPALQDDHRRAPQLVDRLGARLARALRWRCSALLDEAGVAVHVNPRLVRGLDYYNRTVFEWVTDALGAQGTVAGGGRYDGLFEQLGGKPTPACGFAIGVERMILLLQAQGAAHPARP